MELWQLFERHQEALSTSAKYDYERKELLSYQEQRLKCLEEEQALGLRQFDEIAEKEKEAKAREFELILQHTGVMQKNSHAQLKQTQQLAMDHLTSEQKKEDERVTKEIATEEKNLPKKIKQIRALRSVEFDQFLQKRKKEVSEETKKKISVLKGKERAE